MGNIKNAAEGFNDCFDGPHCNIRAPCPRSAKGLFCWKTPISAKIGKYFPARSWRKILARGSAKMSLKRRCGFLGPFATILNEFIQTHAFGGNFWNPNIGVFQQNRPLTDLRDIVLCCSAISRKLPLIHCVKFRVVERQLSRTNLNETTILYPKSKEPAAGFTNNYFWIPAILSSIAAKY